MKKYLLSGFLVVAVLVLVVVLGKDLVPALAAPTTVDEVEVGDPDGGNRAVIGGAGLTMGAGVNQVAWRNMTDDTIYVDQVQLSTTGTASSTFLFNVVASSSSSFPASHNHHAIDFLRAKATSTMIAGLQLATSTVATTTSNMARDLPIATSSGRILRVDPWNYVLVQMQTNACNGDYAATEAIEQGGGCEYATSTNRGFNVEVFLRYNRQR